MQISLTNITINGRPARDFFTDLKQVLRRFRDSKGNEVNKFAKDLVEKTKAQIMFQEREKLPMAEWAGKPLGSETITRERHFREVRGRSRGPEENLWYMMGVLLDSIDEIDTTAPGERHVGVQEDTIYPYIAGKRVGDYAGSVEDRAPLFSVFWKYYEDWMAENVADEANAAIKEKAFHQ